MKLEKKEIILIIIQILGFYLLPFITSYLNKNAVILTILVNLWLSFMISLIISYASKNKYRFMYPLFLVLLFIPTIFIYYNSSALVHIAWYLVVGYAGVGIGYLLNLLKQN